MTKIANKELSVQQLEALKEGLPQLAVGLTSVLSSLGISGLDLAGTYFSGGTLALTGISQAGAVAGTTLTGSGAVVVADAISKMGLQNATISYSFVQNYGQYHKDLKPDNEYNAGEHDYNYKTDDLGRVSEAEAGKLQAKKHIGRERHNPNTLDKLPNDHAGHLFADRFGGSPELNNLLSQAKKVNWKDYGALERKWQKALDMGQEVSVKIKVNYQGTSFRPSSFDVTYTIDGIRFSEVIKNIN